MLKRLRFLSNGTMLALSILMIVVLLAACGGSTTSGTTPTSVPTSAPTQAQSPTAATGAMTAFQGNSFTISYPQNWQTTTKANNIFTFADSTGNIKMTITVAPDPNGTISADSVASTALQAAQVLLKNSQTVTVASTTSVGGDSWSQVSASGTQRLNNQDTNIQVVVIATVHPANTLLSKSFTILYQAPVTTFSQDNTTYFQPMLQSFKFA
ncbi:MAG: hypothetical protein ACXVDN_24225 [Ktedonobacteraceae bacterium]